MIGFRKFLLEGGGQMAGSLEIANVNVDVAVKYADELFRRYQNRSVFKEIPDFKENYERARDKAAEGKTRRHDMPVVEEDQVRDMQRLLMNGAIDVKAPWAPETDPANPFPEGLNGEMAMHFIDNGFRDKKVSDDVVKITEVSLTADDLRPIQKQIYLDKCLEATAKFGVPATKQFLRSTYMIAASSPDLYIIDGHHRWLSAMLIGPETRLRGVKIGLDIRTLLPLAAAYGDAIGNSRNA